jgi:hypothetical protein
MSKMRIVISTVSGFLFGLLLTILLAYSPLGDWLEGNTPFNIVHYPAELFCKAWWMLKLPPHGDQGFVMIFVSIIVQWTILGLITGAVLQFVNKRTD